MTVYGILVMAVAVMLAVYAGVTVHDDAYI